MRIIVVDDHMGAGDAIIRAVADTPHTVRWTGTPESLEEIIARESFDIAFVDMDFGRSSQGSGLTALHQVAARGMHAVIYSADSEENRLLYLLAAFQFYRPLALLAKDASGDAIRALLQAAADGREPAAAVAGGQYRPPAGALSWLDRLIHNPTDLAIWQQLTYFSERSAVALAAGFSARTVDVFLDRQLDTVLELERTFHPRPEHLPLLGDRPDGKDSKKRTRRMVPLHAFAVKHLRFFHDPELPRLLETRFH
jgi:DNA-binding NarL/FixJ family response regulator